MVDSGHFLDALNHQTTHYPRSTGKGVRYDGCHLSFNLQPSTVNAAQQATDIALTTKIASAVSLFRSEFPDAKVDLQPWAADVDTQELVDPDSIDFSFHFPGWSRRWQSRSVLVQIRFYEDAVIVDGEPLESKRSCIGLEVAGFDYRGKQWRLSTVNDWQFEGDLQPQPEIADKLKQFCRQMFELFRL
jgi:hypothetical protein